MQIIYEPGDIVYIDDEGTPFEGTGKLIERKSPTSWMVENMSPWANEPSIHEIQEVNIHVRT